MVKTASFKLTCTPDRRHRSSINQPNGMSVQPGTMVLKPESPWSCLPSPAGTGGGHVCSQGNV